MKSIWKKKAALVLTAGLLAAAPGNGLSWAEETAGEAAEETGTAIESQSVNPLSSEPVRVESIGMEMYTPEGWVTMTSEMEENDPVFTENHMDGAAMLSNYKEYGILIDSLDMEDRIEFNVTLSGKDKTIIHLTQFSDEDVRVYADQLASPESGEEISFRDYEIYDHGQLRFIAGEARINAGGASAGSGMQYYTIVNGNRLCFQMFAFGGELSEEHKTLFKDMIDSVSFDSLQEAGPLSISQGRNPVLEQLSSKYLLRNVIILLGVILIVYYGLGAVKKRGKK